MTEELTRVLEQYVGPWNEPGAQRRQPIAAVTSFVRLVDLSFAAVVSALDTWWEADQSEGFVHAGSTVLVGRLSIEHGIGRVAVIVRRPRRPFTRSLFMELELASWSDRPPMTRLELVARRRVRLSRRYFHIGHQAADILIAELWRSSAVPPGHSHLMDGVRPDGDDDANLMATSVPRVGAAKVALGESLDMLGAAIAREVHDVPTDCKVVSGVERVGNAHGYAWVPLDVPDLLEALDGVDQNVLTVGVNPRLGHLR